MVRPKVSVCIPAYKQPELLCKAIDSVLLQTFQDFEILITDDSPDDSVETALSDYLGKQNIFYYRNIDKKGSPGNWNESIRKARGEYIKILHHDDYFTYPHSLEIFVKLLDQNLNAEIAFSASNVVFQNENYLNRASNFQLERLKKNPNILLYENKIGAPSAIIYRNQSEVLFDSNLKWLVDIEFYIRKIKSSNFVCVDLDLITTYGIDGRVTDYCEGNKIIEIFEYFYIYEKIRRSNLFLFKCDNYKVLLRILYVCKKYSIKSTLDIRNCHFNGKIFLEIKVFILMNKIINFLGI